MASPFVRVRAELMVREDNTTSTLITSTNKKTALLTLRNTTTSIELLQCLLSRFSLSLPTNDSSSSSVDSDDTAVSLDLSSVSLTIDNNPIILSINNEVLVPEKAVVCLTLASTAARESMAARFQHAEEVRKAAIIAAERHRANELLDFVAVPRSQTRHLWNNSNSNSSDTPIVFKLEELLQCQSVETLVAEWRRRSYVVVELDSATVEVLRRGREAASRFFDEAARLDPETLEAVQNSRPFRGFHSRPLFNKRFLMVRQWCPDVWQLSNISSGSSSSSSTEELQKVLVEGREAIEEMYRQLARITEHFTRVAAETVGLPKDVIDTLFEPELQHGQLSHNTTTTTSTTSGNSHSTCDNTLPSASNLTLFHYNVPEGHQQQVRIYL